MRSILLAWHFDLLSVLLAAATVFLYYSICGRASIKSQACFWSAIFLYFIACCSPLHYLGMHYYFSAHMISHILLLLLCGPLIVLSLRPAQNKTATNRIFALSVFLSKKSWLTWLIGAGVMWVWHIPSVHAAVMSATTGIALVPILQTASLLLAGMLFSWPLFGPFPDQRLHPLIGVVYLFTACISCSLLGLLITFAPAATYHLPMAGGMMDMGAADPLGISAATDEQAAGLIMWVPCCLVYLGGCLFLVRSWFSTPGDSTGNILKPLNPSLSSHE